MAGEICTERLRLLPVTTADEEAICGLFWHPDVGRYLSEEIPASRESICEMIAESQDPSAVSAFWRVTLDGGRLIGLVGVWPPATSALALRNIGWRSLEIVFAFHPGVWGRGYAREAIEPVVAHALSDGVTFGVLGAVAEPNTAARSLMLRCGFDVLGHFAGERHPIVVYERSG